MSDNDQNSLSDRIFNSLPMPARRAAQVVEVEVERIVEREVLKEIPTFALFDIEIDGYWMGNFGITNHGIYIREDADEVEWYNACEMTDRAVKGKDWGKADLCLFGMEILGKSAEQVAAVLKISPSSVTTYASLSRSADRAIRILAPSIAHFRLVQKLDRQAQARWLSKAAQEGWSLSTLRVEVDKSLGTVRSGDPRSVSKALSQQKQKARSLGKQAAKLPYLQRQEMVQYLRELAAELEGGS